MARLDDAAVPVTHPQGIAWSPGLWLLLVLTRAGSVIALLIAWELLARSGLLSPFLLPRFSLVIALIAEQMISGAWFKDVGLTLYRAILGFLIAAAIGVPLGILMGRSRRICWFFDPIVSAGFPAPKIAFLPVFILWFDLFDRAKIAMIAFESVFPVIAAAWVGTRAVDKYLVWSARSLGASPAQIMTDVVLPAAMPHILTGLQIAMPMALIITLVCEFVMGGSGLGAEMIYALRFGNSPGVFAGIVSIAFVGFLLVKLLDVLRAHLLIWHEEVQAGRG